MRRIALSVATACGLAFTATAASAADLSGEAGVTSDYRYRGLSLSGGKPAVQASLAIEHSSGAYGELWASTIKDDGAGPIELDGTAGYSATILEGLSFDVSGTYYAYPGGKGANAFEATAAIAAARGPWTATLGISFTPPQKSTRDDLGRKRPNAYAFGGLELAVPGTPLTARGQLGYERGAFDAAANGGKWDWTLGAQATVGSMRVSLEHVGSNAGGDALVGGLFVTF